MIEINRFTLRTLFWLPIAFAAWYFLSVLWVVPIAGAIDFLMPPLLPKMLDGITADGNILIVSTHLALTPADGKTQISEGLLFELHVLKYAYSIPLYTSLVVASLCRDTVSASRWALGMVALFFTVVFGVATDLLKTLAIDLQPITRPTGNFPHWAESPLALLYQLGYLILPPVTPIMLWFVQFPEYWSSFFRTPDSGGSDIA